VRASHQICLHPEIKAARFNFAPSGGGSLGGGKKGGGGGLLF